MSGLIDFYSGDHLDCKREVHDASVAVLLEMPTLGHSECSNL